MEELYYLYGKPLDAAQLALLPKLKRTIFNQKTPNIQLCIDACPSLEYVIFRSEDFIPAEVLQQLEIVGECRKIRKYKNTLIVFAAIFREICANSSLLSLLKPLFVPYTPMGQPYLSSLVEQPQFSAYVLQFFVKELGYDIDGRYLIKIIAKP